MKDQKLNSPATKNLQGYALQVVSVVSTILLVLFGLLAGTFMLGLIMLVAHGLVSAFLVRAVLIGDQKRKEFAIACIAPNLAGYVFAVGGMLGLNLWLFISAMAFALLCILGLGRRVLLLSLSESSFVARIPLIGTWFVPESSKESEHEKELVDDPFDEMPDVPPVETESPKSKANSLDSDRKPSKSA